MWENAFVGRAWGPATPTERPTPMAEASKRKRSITRLFINDDGSTSGRATETTHTVVFKYADDSETRFDLRKIGVDTSKPSVARAAAAFGVSTSAGNAGNTAAAAEGTDDPEFIRGEVEDRLDTIAPNDGSPGVWAAEREAGAPRTGLLLEACIAFRKQHSNKDADPQWLADTRTKLQDKDFVKNLQGDGRFKAILEQLKLKKAEERAAKAAASAGTAGKAAELIG